MDHYRSNNYSAALKEFVITLEKNKTNVTLIDEIIRCIDDIFGRKGITLTDAEETLNWMKKEADTGNSYAQCITSNLYWAIIGLKVDEKELHKYLILSVEQKNPIAYSNLGYRYKDGIHVEKDLIKAEHWMKMGAEAGIVASIATLSDFYFAMEKEAFNKKRNDPSDSDSYTVSENDFKESIKWYTLAATAGDKESQFQLSNAYFIINHANKTHNYEKAIKWATAAANQGHHPAQNSLGNIYLNKEYGIKNFNQALKWYKMAAEGGSIASCSALGGIYYSSEYGVRNPEEAVKWYKLAADAGNVHSQNQLGLIFRGGRGVLANFSEVERYYRMAIDAGCLNACCNLGVVYECHHPNRNLEEAMKLYRMAADKNHPRGVRYVAEMYEKGTRVKVDLGEAFKWYKFGADLGDQDCIKKVGMMYMLGNGVERNYREGVRLLESVGQPVFVGSRLAEWLSDDVKFVREMFEKWKEHEVLKKRIEQLEEENDALKTEIEYMPDGKGYKMAKESAESTFGVICAKQSN